jgi:WD40 repeat protein
LREIIKCKPRKWDSCISARHSLESHNLRPTCTSYLSVNNHVFTYDLRKATAPIVRQENRQTLLEATDEINQISLSCRGDLWVSAADDNGTIQLTDPASARRRVLRHDSSNIAMTMSAVFRPKRRDEIASGGTDCTVHLWDVSKPR